MEADTVSFAPKVTLLVKAKQGSEPLCRPHPDAHTPRAHRAHAREPQAGEAKTLGSAI